MITFLLPVHYHLPPLVGEGMEGGDPFQLPSPAFPIEGRENTQATLSPINYHLPPLWGKEWMGGDLIFPPTTSRLPHPP